MKAFWQSYKLAIIPTVILFVGYGGYCGFVAFQNYETNQINTAVQSKTNQLEQQFSSMQVASSTMNASTSATTTIDNRVNQLEAQIQQLQTTQAQSTKKTTPASTAQIVTLQKQVAAIKNASSGPVITFVNPTIMIAGYTNTVSINGTGFEADAKVKLGDTGLQISGTPTPTSISANYPSGFNPGVYDVTVTNPDGGQFIYPSATTINPGIPTPTNTALTTAQIVSKISPSVVLIRTNLGCGSGMIVQSNGLILTDYHVVNGVSTINVYLSDGLVYPATIQQENASEDLATLQINQSGLPVVSFDDSSDATLPLGSNVVSLGYPTTCNTDQTLVVQAGIITARTTVPSFLYLGELLQTSALINPGASGGPLVDQNGNVVGLNELAETLGLPVNITGISYATQSDVASSFLSNLPSQSTQSATTQSQALTPNGAALNITVNVNNTAGGAATPSNFTITIVGGNPSNSSFPGNASGTQITLDANKFYGVNISSLPNYTVMNNNYCANTGGILAGGTANCTFTETFVPSSN